MRAYREFLRRPYAARLLSGTLVGRLPNGMGALVIVLFVRAHGGCVVGVAAEDDERRPGDLLLPLAHDFY